MANGVSKNWMVVAMVLGALALSASDIAYMQHHTLSAQLSAATDEITLSHDEIANLKTRVRTLQARVGSTP
jgi:hypothetical protein